ncbi:MAG TPA: rod shape-determining protein MreC [Candidatus Sulfotelmatobacter sp.]
MESVLGRYRNLIILVGVLFLQVLGLAMQVKKNGMDEEKTRLIRIWAVGAVTPFERSLVWVQSSTTSLWRNYFYLRGVRAENRQLKEQIEHMRLQQVRLAEDAAQARRLQTLLAFKEQFISRTVAAQVIGSSGSDHSRIIYIDKGENAGIQREMAVMTADGIVGKVLLVYPSVAQVLLINDESSGVGAMLEKTRLQGVLRGTANGEVMLERVMSDEQVPVGETVLTSGGDQIFPKGLPIGTVTKVGSGKDLFLNIKIKTAADLSQLEEVLVLVEKQERQAMADDSVRMRASDILAQRLPSVPDKPVTDANSAASASGTSAATTAATQPKTEIKQPTGTVAKPQGLAGTGKTAATAKAGVTGSTAVGTAQSVKKSASPNGASITVLPDQANKPDSDATSPKTPKGSAVPKTGIEPEGQTNPQSAQPKLLPPPTSPPANPQPAADENKPQ